MFHPANLILNTFAFIQVICFYYIFRFLLYPAIKKQQWISIILMLFGCYLISLILLSVPLYINKDVYPDNVFIDVYFNKYAVKSFSDLVSQYTFLWYITVSFWCNMLTVIVFIGVDMSRIQQSRLAALQARDDMEVGFLRAQVQPHFLFNTLNNIYGLLIDYERESEIVLKLSDLMRYSLYDSRKEYVFLHEEVRFVEQYIQLKRTRLEKTGIALSFSLPKNADERVKIAPLLLPQFLEFVIDTLIQRKGINGIAVSVEKHNQHVVSSITYNNKPGGEKALERDDLPAEWIRRLELEYPQNHTIKWSSGVETNSLSLVLNLSTENHVRSFTI